MNNKLITTIANNEMNAKCVYLTREHLFALLDCVNYANEQVLNSANEIQVLDCEYFDMSKQISILSDLCADIENAIHNFDLLDDVESDVKTTIVDEIDALKARQQHLFDERAALEERLSETADTFLIDVYDKALRAIDSELSKIYDDIHKRDLQLNSVECTQVEKVYKQLHDTVNYCNKAVDAKLVSTDIYNETLFTITVGKETLAVPMFATSFEDLSTLLENVYDIYDGDAKTLKDIEEKSLYDYYY